MNVILKAAGRMHCSASPPGWLCYYLCAIAPISNFGAAKNRSVSPQLAGYKAVRVHYGPMNKMIMPVRINGHSREFAG